MAQSAFLRVNKPIEMAGRVAHLRGMAGATGVGAAGQCRGPLMPLGQHVHAHAAPCAPAWRPLGWRQPCWLILGAVACERLGIRRSPLDVHGAALQGSADSPVCRPPSAKPSAAANAFLSKIKLAIDAFCQKKPHDKHVLDHPYCGWSHIRIMQ